MRNVLKTISSYCVLAGLLWATSCASPNRAAYQILGTTAVTVDKAMSAWGDYVKAGFATKENETWVKEKYIIYQKSMAAAKVAKATYDNSKTDVNKKNLDVALDVVAVATAALLNVVNEITNAR